MKKVLWMIGSIFMILSLTACSSDEWPRTEKIDGVTYRKGFYDDSLLNLNKDLTFEGDNYTIDAREFKHLDFEQFDVIRCRKIGYDNTILYCAEEQWKQAQSYYADDSNYDYYCQFGTENIYRDPVIVAIPDVDSEKFEKLMDFAEKNRYKPSEPVNKNTRTLPIPDIVESPVIIFYKESKDGLLVSVRGYKFYIDNDKLVLLYYYNHGHGEYEEMLVVDVPDEFGQHFVELVANITH
ncbi:hypothetical protein [Anaerosporobacter sp.]|uniref:hypothetical protein n=1 Tax=Anaerosporobacter sp. TaxID=1872529 RepID=UPI00286EF123|nr:hypothetical protein [Anaerosporobacter sp.]